MGRVRIAPEEAVPEATEIASVKSSNKTEVVAEAEPAKSPLSQPDVEALPGPRIAFVLDDWGYGLAAVKILESFDRPVTLAILPNLPYSDQIAQSAHAAGHEIILHMPMEPKGVFDLEEDTILDNMTDDEVREKLSKSFASVPHTVGANNHMGSKVTENKMIMRVVLEALNRDGYFYLDSLTTGRSSVGEIARELNTPYLRRDIFLDNEMTEEAIQGKIDELVEIAKIHGQAIGIGHDKVMTLQVIQRNLEKIKEDGISIVKLSELLERT